MKLTSSAFAFLAAALAASSANAQEIQLRGPLANAPSCRQCVQYRAGRAVLSPSFGVTLQDDFQRSLVFGLQGAYHFNDVIGLGLYAGYAAVGIPTGLANAAQNYTGIPDPMDPTVRTMPFVPSYNVPDREKFTQQIGRMGLMLALPQLTITPLRGKLALFQNIFLDADIYLFGAPALIFVTERKNFDAASGPNTVRPLNDPDVTASQTQTASRPAFTAMFGAGFNFYVNRFISLSFEYRAYPFSWNTSGTDENTSAMTCGANQMSACRGSPDYLVPAGMNGTIQPGPASMGGTAGGRFLIDENDRSFRWNSMFNFSVNIFLPPAARIND